MPHIVHPNGYIELKGRGNVITESAGQNKTNTHTLDGYHATEIGTALGAGNVTVGGGFAVSATRQVLGGALTITKQYDPVAYGGVEGSGIDNTAEIQAAIDAAAATYGGEVYIPAGTWEISKPLVLPNYVAVRGDSRGNSVIAKTTNTVGDSASVDYGAYTDSYAIDSIISLYHAEDEGTQWARLENLHLQGSGGVVPAYGVYAPRMAYCTLRNVRIVASDYGVYARASWVTVLEHVLTYRGVLTDGATGYGFYFDCTTANGGWGTSITMISCYPQYYRYGFYLYGLQYSSLISCASDHQGKEDDTVGVDYYLRDCYGVNLSGCGCEMGYSTNLQVEGGDVTASGFHSTGRLDFSGGDTAAAAIKMGAVVGSGHLTLIGARWSTVANVGFNVYLTSTSHMTAINCILPTGGTGNNIIAGCTLDKWYNGQIDSGGVQISAATDLTKRYQLTQEKTADILDDTFFDVVTFTCAEPFTYRYGVLIGTLRIISMARDTLGLANWGADEYQISIGPSEGVELLQVNITRLHQQNSPSSIVTTLQQKAGGTNLTVTLEAKFTCTNFDTSYSKAMWYLDVATHAMTESTLITPSV